MFQKENSSQGPNRKGKAIDVPVRKSDRRKLLERAKQYFSPSISTDSDQLLTLLETTFLRGNSSARSIPMEAGKAWNLILYLKPPTLAETTGPSTFSVHHWPYTTSPQFVWMALEEKSKVVREVPTVAFWAVLYNVIQDLSPYTIQVPSLVSKYICRGADLMRAGMRSLPTTIDSRPPEMVAIVVQSKHNGAAQQQPFAVGLLKNPQEPYGVGTSGVGVEVWNTYGDDLWRHSCTSKEHCAGKIYANNAGGGLPFDNGHYGNIGFQGGALVLPIRNVEEVGGVSAETDFDDSDSDTPVDKCSDDVREQLNEVEPSNIKITNSEEAETAGADVSTQSRLCTDGTSAPEIRNALPAGGEDKTSSNHAIDDSEPGNVAPSTVNAAEKNDELSIEGILHKAVCQALLSLKNKDFPILLSTFYAQYVKVQLQLLTSDNVDLKDTRYKKFGNYVKEQVERSLLQVGPDNKNKKNTDPMALLIGYDKKHADLEGMEKTTTGTPDVPPKFVLVNLFMIPSHWPALLRLEGDDVKANNATSEDRKGTGMLTAAEVRAILDAYLKREDLIRANQPGEVQLDGPLIQALYKNERAKAPSTLPRKDLVKLFHSKLLPAYALVKMPGSQVVKLAKGAPPKIQVEVSLRQSKKFVTRVRGLEDYGIDPLFFAKDVGRRLACSVTVDETAAPGRPALKKNCVELVLQGNWVEEIEALLVDESLSNHGGVKGSDYSVPKQVIEAILRKGVPGHKKK